MIREFKSRQYPLCSREPDPKTAKRQKPRTFEMRDGAERHEREVQYFKPQ